MEKAIKRKKLYVILSVVTFALAMLLLIPAFLMFASAEYLLIIPFAVLSAACCYANVFLAFAAYDAGVAIKLIPVVNELGCDNVREIAERIGWRRISTRKFINKCIKHGYIS